MLAEELQLMADGKWMISDVSHFSDDASCISINRKKSQQCIMTGKELVDLENIEAIMLEALQIKQTELLIKNKTDGESQWFRASMELDTLDSSTNKSNKMTKNDQE